MLRVNLSVEKFTINDFMHMQLVPMTHTEASLVKRKMEIA